MLVKKAFRQEPMTRTQRTFRMKRSDRKILRSRKAPIERRLARKNFSDQPQPMLLGGNVHYAMAERAGAVGWGGLGWVQDIDEPLELC